jgi:large subunit ribosomal protein L18
MKQASLRIQKRGRRKRGIRRSILGTPQRPRLAVFRSLRHIYAQVIDDLSGRTLASAASTRDEGSNRAAATAVGKRLAEKAAAAGVQQVVFDRAGFRYHGRVKALADAAREAGLKF